MSWTNIDILNNNQAKNVWKFFLFSSDNSSCVIVRSFSFRKNHFWNFFLKKSLWKLSFVSFLSRKYHSGSSLKRKYPLREYKLGSFPLRNHHSKGCHCENTLEKCNSGKYADDPFGAVCTVFRLCVYWTCTWSCRLKVGLVLQLLTGVFSEP